MNGETEFRNLLTGDNSTAIGHRFEWFTADTKTFRCPFWVTGWTLYKGVGGNSRRKVGRSLLPTLFLADAIKSLENGNGR